MSKFPFSIHHYRYFFVWLSNYIQPLSYRQIIISITIFTPSSFGENFHICTHNFYYLLTKLQEHNLTYCVSYAAVTVRDDVKVSLSYPPLKSLKHQPASPNISSSIPSLPYKTAGAPLGVLSNKRLKTAFSLRAELNRKLFARYLVKRPFSERDTFEVL